ncbi:hypothetical protein V3C99_016163 [Haemonchus contortus]
MSLTLVTVYFLLEATISTIIRPDCGEKYYADEGNLDQRELYHKLPEASYEDVEITYYGYGNDYSEIKHVLDHRHKVYFQPRHGSLEHAAGRNHSDTDPPNGYSSDRYESEERTGSDVENTKRFLYFATGSGPEDTYQRGYHGSSGYDKLEHDSKYPDESGGDGLERSYFVYGIRYNEDNSAYKKFYIEYSGHGNQNGLGNQDFNWNGWRRFSYSGPWKNTGSGSGSDAHKSN